jgi:hypothetical protein
VTPLPAASSKALCKAVYTGLIPVGALGETPLRRRLVFCGALAVRSPLGPWGEHGCMAIVRVPDEPLPRQGREPIRGYTCPMASAREERLALNEALFRAANERMGDWEERHRVEATELYFCECADPECRQKVSLHEADYERVRSDSEHFVVVPGHEVADIETVIESHEAWVVVEKAPEIRKIVEATDPRTD